jgi:glucose-6-phosphate 1-dehydrogenase
MGTRLSDPAPYWSSPWFIRGLNCDKGCWQPPFRSTERNETLVGFSTAIAGKNLPVTATEVMVRLRQPPTVFPTAALLPNYFRFQILPRQTVAFGLTIMDDGDQMIGQRAEMVASRQPGAEERAAYERVIGDAIDGDAALFARMDYVDEAWRIVDSLRTLDTPVREYEPGTWGPSAQPGDIMPPGGWADPLMPEAR